VSPELLLNADHGLAIGARLRFATNVSVRMQGAVRASEGTHTLAAFYEADRAITGRWVVVPIGGVPVPFRLALSVGLVCRALPGGKLDTMLRLHTDAHAGGSVVFEPRLDVPPERWFHAGPWPNELDASGDAHFEGGMVETGIGLTCAVPRV